MDQSNMNHDYVIVLPISLGKHFLIQSVGGALSVCSTAFTLAGRSQTYQYKQFNFVAIDIFCVNI